MDCFIVPDRPRRSRKPPRFISDPGQQIRVNQASVPSLFLITLIALLAAAGCSQPSLTPVQTEQTTPAPAAADVYIVYGSEKGDLSYTDAAYRGIAAAQNASLLTVREFVPADYGTLPAILNASGRAQNPPLVITVGFQYKDFTQQLAAQYPGVHFLAIDQEGNGSGNLKMYEITSYGDSYLSGILAATASKNGRVGIIMGMQSDLLDTFIRGYTDGAQAANASIVVEQEYVHRDSVQGFTDPAEAGRIADRMYRNGTDVIFMGAGISNTGAIGLARNTSGLSIIGTDSDQSPLCPSCVLASAVKRVDREVYNGIAEHRNGTFTGGRTVAGLREGATGIVLNPSFAEYNTTVIAWEARAAEEEERYLASRGIAGTE